MNARPKFPKKYIEGTPRKVGQFYDDLSRQFCYMDVKFESGKWADSSKYLPSDFDLCHCKIGEDKIKSGWYNGSNWDGSKIKHDETVLFWKPNHNF